MKTWWAKRDEKANLFLAVPRPKIARVSQGIQEGTTKARVRDVLAANGKPMHVKNILRALGKRPTTKAVRSLRQALYPLSSKGEVFSKPDVETFGLASWVTAPVYRRSRQGVRAILLAHGKPMHGNEILSALGEKVTTPNRCRLASMLNQWVLQGVEFTRPAPSTWGLLDWKRSGRSLTKGAKAS